MLALLITAGLVLGDLLIRATGPSLGDLATFGTALVAAGFGCVAGLLVRRAPGGALLSAIAASSLAALDIDGVVQAERLVLAPREWWPWLGDATVAIGGAALVAAITLIDLGIRDHAAVRRVALAVSVIGMAIVGTLARIAYWPVPKLGPDGLPDPTGLRSTGRAAVVMISASIALAVWMVGRAPIARARASATLAGPGRLPQAAAFWSALVEELLRRPSRRQVETEERARLAADIHARLLPGLRRAALAASEPGVPAGVAEGLRAAVSDAESLMEARESVVLEAFGLVPALEWLAERTEERDGVEVAINLDAAGPAAEPPRTIARAAFRVALLALDNAVRHGRPTSIVIALRGEARTGRLSVSDDGSGIEVGRPRPAGRGIRDMASLAGSIGGSLDVHAGSVMGGGGTTVELTWPAPNPGAADHAAIEAAGNPATRARGTTAGDGEAPV